jgi:hypothetical protein
LPEVLHQTRDKSLAGSKTLDLVKDGIRVFVVELKRLDLLVQQVANADDADYRLRLPRIARFSVIPLASADHTPCQPAERRRIPGHLTCMVAERYPA